MLLVFLPILLLTSCATREYIAIEPEMPKLPSIEEVVDMDTLDAIRKPLDLIAEPSTVGEVLYNLSEFRKGYVNWRTYATALEEYYEEVARILRGGKEE